MRTMLTLVNVVQIITSDIAKAVYIRFTVFSNFSKFQFVSTFWHFRNFYCGDAHHAHNAKYSLYHHFQHSANCLYEIYNLLKLFEIVVRKCCLFCTFWLLPNFYSGDAHHANYGERCSNHHFRYSANCVYKIYNVLKIFELAVCFAHFGYYQIYTPLMRAILTMPNIV